VSNFGSSKVFTSILYFGVSHCELNLFGRSKGLFKTSEVTNGGVLIRAMEGGVIKLEH